MRTRKHQYAFAGGEVSPEFYGRGDAVQFQTGLGLSRNWLIKSQGSARTRPGMESIQRSYNQGSAAQLIPFIYDLDQSYAIEAGAGIFRFHADTTLKWATVIEVGTLDSSTIDVNNDIIVTKEPHGLATGDAVRLAFDAGSTPPSPLNTTTDYLALVIDSRRFQIDVTPYPGPPSTVATNITSTGSGVMRVYKAATLPSDYVAPITFGAGAVTTGVGSKIRLTVPSVLRTYKVGETVQFTSSGTLPAPLVAGTDYEIESVTPVTSTSVDLTFVGITFTTTGTGTHTIYRSYRVGDLVFLAAAKSPFSASAVLYCRVAQLSTAGALTAGDWFEQTSDGILTVPSPYAADDVFDLTFDQSGDIITLAHPRYSERELRRYDDLRWTLEEVQFASTLTAPSPSVTRDFGEQVKTYVIKSDATTGHSTFELGVGDFVGVEVGTPMLCTFSETDGLADGFGEDTIYIVTKYTPGSGTTPGTLQFRTLSGDRKLYNAASIGASPQSWLHYFAFTDLISDDNEYKVSAVDEVGNEKLSASTGAIINNLTNVGASNTVSWSAVTGATRYRVYKKQSGAGLFGLIGETTSTSFVDADLPPDMTETAPIVDANISNAENYSRATARFDQRRCFAGSDLFPRRLFMSRSGTETDFTYRIPLLDDDRIAVEVAAREAHVIRHIVPLGDLLLLTQLGEWRVFAINSDAITPTTIAVRPQSYVGSSGVRPQIINNSLVFCAARGGHVREMGFQASQQGYVTGDLSLRAAHLFDGYELTSSAYQKAPYPVVWFTSTSGKLLGMTYIPEEDVRAWHQHTTDGTIESVCVIPRAGEDRVYVTAARTLGGSTVRNVERLGKATISNVLDTTCLDESKRVDGTGAGTLTITGGVRAGDTVTVTASGATAFSIFDEEDYIVVGAAGYVVHITEWTSANTVTGTLKTDIALSDRGVALSSWAIGRKVLGGFEALEGQTVGVTWTNRPDGAVFTETATVTGGQIRLSNYATIADVGRPFVCDLKLLPVTLQVDALGYGRTKAVNRAWLRVYEAAGLSVGSEALTRPVAALAGRGALVSEQTRELVPADYSDDAQLLVRQSLPLPATIAAVTIEVSVAE